MSTPLAVNVVAIHTNPDWWTIGLTALATIIGAAIGAVVAFLVARQTAIDQRAVESIQRRELEELTTMRASVGIMRLVNATAGYRNQIKASLVDADARLPTGTPLCFRLKSSHGAFEEIELSPDDLLIFIKSRNVGFVGRLLFAVSRYRALCGALDYYANQRDGLLARIVPAEMTGLIGTMMLSKDEERILSPHIASVSDLGEQLILDLDEVFELSTDACREFGKLARAYFGDPTFPIPSVPDAGMPA